MKLNQKLYRTLNNPVETQNINGKVVEIHYMNDTPYLSRYAGKGHFVIWSSDGVGFKLLVERDYYLTMNELHSAKTNELWLKFYSDVHNVRKTLFIKIMLPLIAFILAVMVLFGLVEQLREYQMPILIGSLILMLVVNMFQSNLLRKKIDESRTRTINGIEELLGKDDFERLVKLQNDFFERYFKFEEPAVQDEKEEKNEVQEADFQQIASDNEINSKEDPKDDYEKLTVAKLKELAKEKNIVGYSTLKKAELIELLKKNEEV